MAVVICHLINGDDARMIERRRRTPFGEHALPHITLADYATREDLDSHLATKLFIARAIDPAHASAANLLQNRIVSDRLPDHRRSPRAFPKKIVNSPPEIES